MPPDSNHDLNHREQPVYRPSHRQGMDATTRRLAIAAGGIGIVLAALVGGWSLMGHHGSGIPVIEAPTGPERVKPADPGGLQLMGAEPPPANADAGTGPGAGPNLAPGPETPDPKALQAQLDHASKADMAAGPPPTSTPAPAKPPVSPVAAAPAAPPPPAPAPAQPAPSTGHVEVQLAAMESDTLAHAEWTRLAHKAPALFADRHPAVTTATRAGKTFYRLRTGGFATIAEATAFCARVRAIGAACTIAAF